MDFLQDVRLSLRIFRRNPVFTLAAVFVLALSIGANASIFTVVDSILIRPLEYRHPERLVTIWSISPDHRRHPFTIPGFLDYRERSRVFDSIAALGSWNANLSGEGNPQRVTGVRASANYFEMLGVVPAAGRVFVPDDDAPGRPKVALLAYPLFQQRYGGDFEVVGRNILLNGEPYTVVGVLPPHFRFPGSLAEIAVPLSPDTDPWRNNRNSVHFLRLFGRLKAGISVDDANADLNRIARELLREYPVDNANVGVELALLKQELVGNSQTMLWILAAAVGMVLAMVCANLASLFLVKASARGKEMAVRAALGGSRMRLLRQLVTESVLLSLAGGVGGTALAGWGVTLMLQLSPAQLPRAAEVQVNTAVLGVALAVSVLCGIVFGSIPALHVLGPDLNTGLRSDSRGASGGPRHGCVRRALVVAQVALSFMLLAGAGLLIRSFLILDGVDPGFRDAHVLTAHLSLPSNRYSTRRDVLTFHDRLLARLSPLPGVELAGATNILPLSGLLATADFTIQGVATPPGKAGPSAHYRMVDAGYFGTMGIPILAGRGIRASDTDRTMSVAVASQSLAQRYWPNAPVGSHILLDDDSSAPPRTVEIVGVAGDVRGQSLEEAPMECLYVPLAQIPEDVVRFVADDFFWVARTSQSPDALSKAVRREIQGVDGDVAAAAIQPMTQYLDQSFAARRFALEVFVAFAVAALLLAAAGLYALVSYSVAQRTREIGVRIALGATQRSVLLLVMREGLGLAAAGIVAGVVGAAALTRTMSALLFGVSAHDPATMAAVSVLLLGATGAACCFPARRAARVDPMVAWRSE